MGTRLVRSDRPSAIIEPLEARIAPSTLIGLDNSNHLLRFNSATPGTVASLAVTNLGAGETLVGIDFDPSLGALIGLTISGTSAGHLYTIDPVSGSAIGSTLLNPAPSDSTLPYATLSGASFGVNFDPIGGGLHVVSDTGQNLKVGLNGQVTTNDPLPAGHAVGGVAYSNPYLGAPDTTLFDLDATTDTLFKQNPITGALTPVGAGLGVDFAQSLGFDIGQGKNEVFAALTAGGSTSLYAIDLNAGTAANLGAVGMGTTPLRGLAVVQNVWTGIGVDNAWTTGANWRSGFAPSPGDSLLFPNSAQQKANIDTFPDDTQFNVIRFTGAGYDVTGFHPLLVSGGVHVSLGSSVALHVPITLNSSGSANVLESRDGSELVLDDVTFTGASGLDIVGDSTVRWLGLNSDDATQPVQIDGPTVIVDGNGVYANDTQLISGQLVLNRSLPNSALAVSGGIVSGPGKVGSLSANGGKLVAATKSPSIEGAAEFLPGSTMEFDFPAAPLLPSFVTPVTVGGSLKLGGTLVVNTFASVPGQFTLIRNDSSGPVEDTFAGLAEGATLSLGGTDYAISYVGGDGNDVTLTRGNSLAPSLSGDGKSATFADVDGDLVTVKVSKGKLTAANFILRDAGGGHAQLEVLDLSGDPAFTGASITFTAAAAAGGAKSTVNVGYINATGVDLGSVTIPGDLGAIDCGDGVSKTAALKGLTIGSLGATGASTGAPDLHSDINGLVGKFIVHGNVALASVLVFDSPTNDPQGGLNANATISSLTIEGTLSGGAADDSGSIEALRAISKAKITGSITGGDGERSGRLSAGKTLGTVTVGGSLNGGIGTDSGTIACQLGASGSISITGDLQGGGGIGSGTIDVQDVKSITIGDLIGGTGLNSARITAENTGKIVIDGPVTGDGEGSASVSVAKIGSMVVNGGITGTAHASAVIDLGGLVTPTGTLVVNGSLTGGGGDDSGQIFGVDVKSVTIGGSVTGGAGANSGSIQLVSSNPKALASVKVGASVQGDAGTNSGSLLLGNVKSISIAGSLSGANGISSGSIVAQSIASATILGGVAGSSGPRSGNIVSFGKIGSLNIVGSLSAGQASDSGAIHAQTHIDKLTLGGIQGDPAHPAVISAGGTSVPKGTADLAIGTLKITGNVDNAQILAGYGTDLTPTNADAQIGKVTIEGDWGASSMVAGAVANAGGFGDGDDAKISGVGTTDTAGIVSRIVSILIKGQATGTVGGADQFGFVAQEIGSLKVGATAIALTKGTNNDHLIPVGATGDFNVQEIAV